MPDKVQSLFNQLTPKGKMFKVLHRKVGRKRGYFAPANRPVSSGSSMSVGSSEEVKISEVKDDQKVIGRKLYALKILVENGIEEAKGMVNEKYHAYLNNFNNQPSKIKEETDNLNKKMVEHSIL